MTTWNKLLIVGRDGDGIGDLIRGALPDLAISVRSEDEVSGADVSAAEMLLAFRLAPRLKDHVGKLRWIQSLGAGVDGILQCGGISEKTLLTRVMGVFGEPMAEYVLSRCLAFAQETSRLEQEQRDRSWNPFRPRLLSEISVLVLGLGDIGKVVAARLIANGAKVSAVSRSGRPEPGVQKVWSIKDWEEALPDAQVMVVVLPLTGETRGLINDDVLKRLPEGAFLINVARGPVVDEKALARAVESGHLQGAALDVFETEPLPQESPLWSAPGVMISPHVAAVTTPDQAASAFVENWKCIQSGKAPRGLVDASVGY